MLHGHGIYNYGNQTLINIPWNQVVQALSKPRVFRVELENVTLNGNEALISVNELHHDYSWFYTLFWLFVGVFITVAMHMPVYAYLVTLNRRQAINKVELNDTCPPKYENTVLENGVHHNLEFVEVDPAPKPSSDHHGEADPDTKTERRPDMPAIPANDQRPV